MSCFNFRLIKFNLSCNFYWFLLQRLDQEENLKSFADIFKIEVRRQCLIKHKFKIS